MIYQNVELHNVPEVRPAPNTGGVRLQRVPESVRAHLNPGAQERMLNPDCTEIRFLSDSPTVRVTLSSEGSTGAVVLFGPFQHSERFTITQAPQTIEITMPERLRQLDPSYCRDMPFSPNVYRLLLGGPARDPLVFHEVRGQGIRPPEPKDVPRLRYLAYGTSITHGASATGPHLTYVSQAARRLGVDLLNLGVGGSAYCEPELADYIADRDDWDFATLALSVNMIGAGFSLEAFYERVSYMVNAVAGVNTERPVACITLYPHFRDFGEPFAAHTEAKSEEYRQMLRDAVKNCPHPNAHLLEGRDILSDFTGLTGDLIHPADNGMIQMGANLARLLEPLVDGLRDSERSASR